MGRSSASDDEGEPAASGLTPRSGARALLPERESGHAAGIRLRDIAAAVGITERAAHRILSELVEEGYVLRERQGRRNRYQVVAGRPLRHPLVQEREVGDLLEVLIGSTTGEAAEMTLEV